MTPNLSHQGFSVEGLYSLRNGNVVAGVVDEVDPIEEFSSQRTVSTELYLPPTQNPGLSFKLAPRDSTSCAGSENQQCCRQSRTVVASVPLLSPSQEVSLDSPGRFPVDGGTVKTSSGRGEVEGVFSHGGQERISCSGYTRKSSKRRKVGNTQLGSADVAAAVGLTVTAAEAMVLAGILAECTSGSNLSPSMILEATIQLRRARQMWGLDDYDVGSTSVSGAHEEVLRVNNSGDIQAAADDEPLKALDDVEMQEAMADVGFIEASAAEPGHLEEVHLPGYDDVHSQEGWRPDLPCNRARPYRDETRTNTLDVLIPNTKYVCERDRTHSRDRKSLRKEEHSISKDILSEKEIGTAPLWKYGGCVDSALRPDKMQWQESDSRPNLAVAKEKLNEEVPKSSERNERVDAAFNSTAGKKQDLGLSLAVENSRVELSALTPTMGDNCKRPFPSADLTSPPVVSGVAICHSQGHGPLQVVGRQSERHTGHGDLTVRVDHVDAIIHKSQEDLFQDGMAGKEMNGRPCSSVEPIKDLECPTVQCEQSRGKLLTKSAVAEHAERACIIPKDLVPTSLCSEEKNTGHAKLSLLETGGTRNPVKLPESKVTIRVPACVHEDIHEENFQLHCSGQQGSTAVVTMTSKPSGEGSGSPIKLFSSRWYGGWTGLGHVLPNKVRGTTETSSDAPEAEVDMHYLPEPWDIGTEDAMPERATALTCLRSKQQDYQTITTTCFTVPAIKELLCPSEAPVSLGEDQVECVPLGTARVQEQASRKAGIVPQGSHLGSVAFSSHADPLCSFVPCSISVPDASCLPAHINSQSDLSLVARVKAMSLAVGGIGNNGIQAISVRNRCAAEMLNLVFPSGCMGETKETQEHLHERDHGGGKLAPDSVKRTHVASLRPYSTCATASASALGLRLHSVELTAKMHGNRGKFLETPHVPRLATSRGNDALQSEEQLLANKSANFISSGCVLADEDISSPLNLEAPAGTPVPVETVPGVNQEGATRMHGKVCGPEKQCLPHPSSSEYISQSESPPLLWPNGRKRRLRACRIVETGSDYHPDEGETPCSCPISPMIDATRLTGNQGVNESGSVATEELQHIHLKKVAATGDVNIADEVVKSFAPKQPQKSNGGAKDRASLLKRPKAAKETTSRNEPKVGSKKPSKKTGRKEATAVREAIGIKNKSIPNGQQEQGLLFGGLRFLLTGFSLKKKDDLIKTIKENGGVVLLNVPARKLRGNGREKQGPPIVISPQLVRTHKFLYGCAVASPLIKPAWINASIAAHEPLLFAKYEHKPKKRVKSLAPGPAGKEANHLYDRGSLFHNIQVFLHGKPTFRTQFTALIQHGGGKVVGNVKAIAQENRAAGTLVGVVVAEEPCRVPRNLRHLVASLKLPLMAGKWVVESLLARRLLLLPTTAANLRHTTQPCQSTSLTGPGGNVQQGSRRKPLANAERGAQRPDIQASTLRTRNCNLHKDKLLNPLKANSGFTVVAPDCRQEDSLGWFWLGSGSASPLTVPHLAAGLTGQVLNAFSGRKCQKKYSYYGAFSMDGVQYCLGDNIEIQPTSEGSMPSIARIEGLWSEGQKSAVSVADVQKKGKKVAMRCRWFYRPSDTGFPCYSSENDLYLSNHFEDDIPVCKILKKVNLTLFVGGKAIPCNNWNPEGDLNCDSLRSPNVGLGEAYTCTFFYDYCKESLHQL